MKSKALIAIVAVAVIGFVASRFIPKTEEQILVPPTEPLTTKETASSTTNSAYKDGSYSARGVYYSPEGLERITVDVVLKDGVISDATVVGEATNSTSKLYQGMFVNNFKQFVVGKDIDSVNLKKVSGSSLTGSGFNNALDKIKAEARA